MVGTDSTKRQRLLAQDDALREENLSEHERDVIWNQEAESIEIEARVTSSTFQPISVCSIEVYQAGVRTPVRLY